MQAHLRLPYRGTAAAPSFDSRKEARSNSAEVLTFSHFLPLTTLPFESTGKQGQAMGCEEIEEGERKHGL